VIQVSVHVLKFLISNNFYIYIFYEDISIPIPLCMNSDMSYKWQYRKPPTISPGLIYFRKRFLMGLYKGGLIYTGGLIHGRSFVLVINKSDKNKSVINREIYVY
jgi:hypothetical protein